MRKNARRCLVKFELVKHFVKIRIICAACGYCRSQHVTASIKDGKEKGDSLCSECLLEISSLSPIGGEIMHRLRDYYMAEIEVPDYLDWSFAELQQAELADEE